jgi:ABC-type lipoprotein release transport system permease subunit
MIQTYKLAWRNLFRNRRRSILSSLALGIGLALLLFMASIIASEMRTAVETGIKLQTGHLQVRAASYDENKTSLAWEDLVQDPEALAAQVSAIPGVSAATPRLYANAILASGEQSVGMLVIGVEPDSLANAPYRDGLVSGAFPSADDREGILLGQPLADKLGVKTGDKVNLAINTSNGDVDEQLFTIRGTFSTGNPGYDRSVLFMPLAKAQAITRTDGYASTLFILLTNRDLTDSVASALPAGPYQVKNWHDMNSFVLVYQDLADSYMWLLYLIILGITATVIINALIMAVFERKREIGIMSAMGMRGSQIMALFFAESSLLAVGGIAIGLALGALIVAYVGRYGIYFGDIGATGIWFGTRLYALMTVKDVVTLSVLAFIVTLLAALYPAAMAANLEPVEAMRGGK